MPKEGKVAGLFWNMYSYYLSITTNLWFKIMGGINEQALVCVTLSLWSRWHEPLPPIVNKHQIRHLPFAFCPKFNWCKGMSSRRRTNSTRIELEKLLNWGAAFRSSATFIKYFLQKSSKRSHANSLKSHMRSQDDFYRASNHSQLYRFNPFRRCSGISTLWNPPATSIDPMYCCVYE